ncbi:MAG: hypothetical protein U0271_43865 [Polyangiaceae bacterium]
MKSTLPRLRFAVALALSTSLFGCGGRYLTLIGPDLAVLEEVTTPTFSGVSVESLTLPEDFDYDQDVIDKVAAMRGLPSGLSANEVMRRNFESTLLRSPSMVNGTLPPVRLKIAIDELDFAPKQAALLAIPDIVFFPAWMLFGAPSHGFCKDVDITYHAEVGELRRDYHYVIDDCDIAGTYWSTIDPLVTHMGHTLWQLMIDLKADYQALADGKLAAHPEPVERELDGDLKAYYHAPMRVAAAAQNVKTTVSTVVQKGQTAEQVLEILGPPTTKSILPNAPEGCKDLWTWIEKEGSSTKAKTVLFDADMHVCAAAEAVVGQ